MIKRWEFYNSNKPFFEKKGYAGCSNPCYVTSTLKSEQELYDYPNWDFKAYEKRRERLEAFIEKRWNVDFSGIISSIDINEDDDE